MAYVSASEIAKKWGVNVSLVRRYCNENRIPGTVYEQGIWKIPSTAEKPPRKKQEDSEKQKKKINKPPIASKLQNQQKKKNFHGLYDYVIWNLTYSSCRMASVRLTLDQVKSIIDTGKVNVAFEAMKVSDLIEVLNHARCVDYIIEHFDEPLTQKLVKRVHAMLMSGTVDEMCNRVSAGEYRKNSATVKVRKGASMPDKIHTALGTVLKDYESEQEVQLSHILALHVKFEAIIPFSDGNGRVGRLLMFKECLRNGVMPFVIDDKRRSRYLQGLREWKDNPDVLTAVVIEAQQRFAREVEHQKILARPQNRFEEIMLNK